MAKKLKALVNPRTGEVTLDKSKEISLARKKAVPEGMCKKHPVHKLNDKGHLNEQGEEGITITISQKDGKTATRSLSDFLLMFETPNQRHMVRTSAHATLRNYGKIPKTREEIAAKRAELSRDPQSTAAYWNGDGWGSIDGIRDAENWIKGEMDKFING